MFSFRKLAGKAPCMHPMRQALGRPGIERAHACHACMRKRFSGLCQIGSRTAGEPYFLIKSTSVAPPPRQLEMRTAVEPHAWGCRGYPSFRKFWGGASTPAPSPCCHAWGFKHHNYNYTAPSYFPSLQSGKRTAGENLWKGTYKARTGHRIQRKSHSLNWAYVSLEARVPFSSLIPMSFERPMCIRWGDP